MGLRVHRTDCGPGYWQVADLPFGVTSHGDLGRCWAITASSPDITTVDAVKRWMADRDLAAQRFRSRREALRTLQAILTVDPLPDRLAVSYLSVPGMGDGWRSPDGRFEVGRCESGDWDLTDNLMRETMRLPSLSEVRFHVRQCSTHFPASG